MEKCGVNPTLFISWLINFHKLIILLDFYVLWFQRFKFYTKNYKFCPWFFFILLKNSAPAYNLTMNKIAKAQTLLETKIRTNFSSNCYSILLAKGHYQSEKICMSKRSLFPVIKIINNRRLKMHSQVYDNFWQLKAL